MPPRTVAGGHPDDWREDGYRCTQTVDLLLIARDVKCRELRVGRASATTMRGEPPNVVNGGEVAHGESHPAIQCGTQVAMSEYTLIDGGPGSCRPRDHGHPHSRDGVRLGRGGRIAPAYDGVTAAEHLTQPGGHAHGIKRRDEIHCCTRGSVGQRSQERQPRMRTCRQHPPPCARVDTGCRDHHIGECAQEERRAAQTGQRRCSSNPHTTAAESGGGGRSCCGRKRRRSVP